MGMGLKAICLQYDKESGKVCGNIVEFSFRYVYAIIKGDTP